MISTSYRRGLKGAGFGTGLKYRTLFEAQYFRVTATRARWRTRSWPTSRVACSSRARPRAFVRTVRRPLEPL